MKGFCSVVAIVLVCSFCLAGQSIGIAGVRMCEFMIAGGSSDPSWISLGSEAIQTETTLTGPWRYLCASLHGRCRQTPKTAIVKL